MYDVSAGYEIAKSLPAQKHRITGTISRDGTLVSNINMSDIIEDSFSIRNQCCNNGEINFGSCYIGELSCEFIERKNDQIDGHTTPTTGVDIAFGSWVGLVIEPYFEILYGNSWEQVPLGKYVVKEAHHTENGVQITAYDLMCNFDAEIPDANMAYLLGLKTDNLYAFAHYACSQVGAFLGMTKAEFDLLPNATSSTENIEIYGDTSDGKEFSNDLTTYRDLLYWIGQTMCCFATMNRYGELEFRRFPKTKNPDAIINPDERLGGMTLADYVTHITGIYVTNLDDNKEMYYGSDAAALQLEIDDVTADLESENQDLLQNAADQAEVQEKYEHGEITEADYNAQMAELRHAEKEIRANIKQLNKRLVWLNKALESASYAKASSIELGPNPFLMYGGKRSTQNTHRKKVLKNALALSYTPFSMSVVCGWHYDLGDLIQIAGGRFNSAQDSFCCVMGYTFNLNGECTLEGYGENPALAKVKTKASRQANTANTNAINSKEITSGTDDPEGGKDNDIYIKYANHVTKTPKVTVELDGHVIPENIPDDPTSDQFKITDFGWDDQVGGYYLKASGWMHDRGSTESNWAFNPIIKANFTAAGHYQIVCDAKWKTENVQFWWFDQPPSLNGITHSNTSAYDVPTSWLNFGTTSDGDWEVHHCESLDGAIGSNISDADIQQGDMRLWLNFAYAQPIDDKCYLEIEITGLKFVYVDPNTGVPDPDGGVNTQTEKYIDHVYVKTEDESGNKVWKEIEYVAGADTSQNSGLSLNYKRWLSLTPDVMRAIIKADPPQADVNFNRYCVRYTGEPDKTLGVSFEYAANWSNTSGYPQKTKEHVYTIKNHGAYQSGTVQQISYKITGLVPGQKYWFNFWAKFTGAEFGEDFRKGLGLVWATSSTISTDDWEGNPHTYNDTTKYLSFYRKNGKRYYEAGVTATASTMYMILTVGDLTDGNDITFTMGDVVISQSRKKYARSIYLYDVDTKTWIKYKPFGASDDDGESEISYLNELNDVEINNASNGQFLVYNNGDWINADMPIASANSVGGIKVGQNLTIDADGTLNATGGGSDVTANPQDTATADLEKVKIDGTTYAVGGADTLSDLTDTAITSPSDEDVLQYDGSASKWINVTWTAFKAKLKTYFDTVYAKISSLAAHATVPLDNTTLKIGSDGSDSAVYSTCTKSTYYPSTSTLSLATKTAYDVTQLQEVFIPQVDITEKSDTDPYIYRASVANGDRCYLRQLVGASFGVNQLFPIDSYAYSNKGYSISCVNGKLTVTGTSQESAYVSLFPSSIYQQVKPIQNHKYLLYCVGTHNFNYLRFSIYGDTIQHINLTAANNNTTIINCTSTNTTDAELQAYRVNGSSISGTIQTYFADLTQMFGTTIADHIYSLEQATAGAGVAFFRKYFTASYYPYNAGELLSVEVEGKRYGNKNLVEGVESGIIDTTTGQNTTGSGYRTKNYLIVKPSQAYTISGLKSNSAFRVFYYDISKNFLGSEALTNVANYKVTFTTWANAGYIRFQAGAAIMDATTPVQCEIGDTATTYAPYHLTTYTFPSQTLRGLFTLVDGELKASGDVYREDGTLERNFIEDTNLGSLTWEYKTDSGHEHFLGTITGVKSTASEVIVECAKYTPMTGADVYNHVMDKSIGVSSAGKIIVYDSAYNNATTFKNAVDGIYITAKKATPTTEQVEPLTMPQICDKNGTEEFITDGIVPVGHESTYYNYPDYMEEGEYKDFRDRVDYAPERAKWKKVGEYSNGDTVNISGWYNEIMCMGYHTAMSGTIHEGGTFPFELYGKSAMNVTQSSGNYIFIGANKTLETNGYQKVVIYVR